jgi:hypothetical protein
MKLSFIFLEIFTSRYVCALVLIRISLNFITVIPRRIIAEDVKLYIMLRAKRISSDNDGAVDGNEKA